MDRKEFLSVMGLSASTLVIGCLAGCSKDSGGSAPTPAPTGVDFTLDLSLAANAALNTNGGYLYKNGIIVARTLAGDFIAVQQVCTHASFSVIYQADNHRFYCNGHGSTFSETGQVTGGPAPASLHTYNTTLTGTTLRVYS